MTKPFFQHYIPKTYLKHFQIDSEVNKNFVYCIDFSNPYNKKIQKVGVNDKVFKRRKYYNDNRLENPFTIENMFSKAVEPLYEKIIQVIKNETEITLSIREDLIVWTFVSKMRNPDLREGIDRIMSFVIDMTNRYNKVTPSLREQSLIENYIKRSSKEIQLDVFINEETLKIHSDLHQETLICKHWKILKSTKNNPFLTNDNPGFSPNQDPRFSIYNPYHNVMELNSQSIIFYVLSPDYCLEIRPFFEGTDLETNSLNMNIKFEEAASEYIAFINEGVFYTRHKLMISNSKNDLSKYIK